MTVSGFTEVSSSKRKRRDSTSSASCTFTAACEASDGQTNDDIEESVETEFSEADASIFEALSEVSLLSASLDLTDTDDVTTTVASIITTDSDDVTFAMTTSDSESTITESTTQADLTTAPLLTVIECSNGNEPEPVCEVYKIAAGVCDIHALHDNVDYINWGFSYSNNEIEVLDEYVQNCEDGFITICKDVCDQVNHLAHEPILDIHLSAGDKRSIYPSGCS